MFMTNKKREIIGDMIDDNLMALNHQSSFKEETEKALKNPSVSEKEKAKLEVELLSRQDKVEKLEGKIKILEGKKKSFFCFGIK